MAPEDLVVGADLAAEVSEEVVEAADGALEDDNPASFSIKQSKSFGKHLRVPYNSVTT